MFKSKWQQRYETAIRNAEFWIEHYQHAIDTYAKSDDEESIRIRTWNVARLQTWKDVLNDLKHIEQIYIP